MAKSPLETLRDYGYENHAFISWTHDIEKRGYEIVQELYSALTDKLKNHIRGGGKIYLDKKRLKNGFKLDVALRQSLCKSALTIVILTPTYFQSDYCLIEWAITEKLLNPRLPDDKPSETCFIHIAFSKHLILPKEISSIRYEKDFLPIITYAKNFKTHPKWNSLIDRITDDIIRICSEISRTDKPDWKEELKTAKNTRKKKFTSPTKGVLASTASRKERKLFKMKVE